MPEDESWTLRKVLGIAASVITLLMGVDWLWNKSAAITWIASTVWPGLFISVKFWHLIAVGALITGGRYGWLYLHSNDESGSDSNRLTKQDIEEIKRRAEERPDWKDYTSDYIEGVDWTWQWNGDEVVDLQPLCPEDGCRWDLELENDLTGDHGSSTDSDAASALKQEFMAKANSLYDSPSKVTCDNCDFARTWLIPAEEVENNVKREIKGRIRRDDYDT